MQKAIHVEDNNAVSRILSIADISIIENNPTGLLYIPVEYVEEPKLADPALDKAYPMYNKNTGVMFWEVVNYQYTATDEVLARKNLEEKIRVIEQEKQKLQECVDMLLYDNLNTQTP